MKISSKERYNAVVLELKGNVMGGPDAELFKDELRKNLELGRKNVVVDLSKVTLMNSSGLGILVSGLTTITNAGGEMKICNPTDKIESLLIMTRLITIFDSYKSQDDAVSSFAD